jgi:hypothetical protein
MLTVSTSEPTATATLYNIQVVAPPVLWSVDAHEVAYWLSSPSRSAVGVSVNAIDVNTGLPFTR